MQKIYDLDIQEVIERNGLKLKKQGANFVACCPFHNETTPSFTVFPAKQNYKCFGCGKSGKSINFVMELEKLDFINAIKKIANQFEINLEYDKTFSPEQAQAYQEQQDRKASLLATLNAANHYYQQELQKSSQEALSFLANRYFSQETINLFELGYKPDNFEIVKNPAYNKDFLLSLDLAKKSEKGIIYDNYRNRITIPLYSEKGNLLGFAGRILPQHATKKNDRGEVQKFAKYINPKETELYKKEKFLYGLFEAKEAIKKENHCFLVEGYPNVWRMHDICLPNVVACCGTAFTKEQALLLKKYCENITILFDPDKIKGEYKYTNEKGEIITVIEEGKPIETAIYTALDAGFVVNVLPLPTDVKQGKTKPDDLDEIAVAYCKREPKTYKENTAALVKRKPLKWLIYLFQYHYSEHKQQEFIEEVCQRIAVIENDVIRNSYESVLYARFKNIAGTIKKLIKSYRDKTPSQAETKQANRVDYNKDGTVWIFTKKNWTQVLDHHLEIKYFAKDEFDNVSWILAIKQPDIAEEFVEISNDEYCSSSKLKNILMTKLVNWKGTSDDLNELHQHLLSKHFEKATKIVRFGYNEQANAFFFANKVIDTKAYSPNDLGVVKNDNGYFVMPITDSKEILKQRFLLTEKHINFNQWFLLYSEAHKRENAFIPASFYVMSLFRDIVVNITKASPILYLKGGAGTGKSSIVRNLTALFGYEQKGINLKNSNTEKSLVRLMGQSSNTVIWFDEFYNGFPYEGLLQAAYDNDGYNIADASAGSKTHSIDIFSALAITSNYTPENNIFFSRCVFIPINDVQKTKEQKVAFDNLSNLEKTKGMGCITAELLAYRQVVIDNFAKSYAAIYKVLKNKTESLGVMERAVANIARIFTPAYILQINGYISMCENTDQEDVLQEFVDFGYQTIIRQHNVQNEKSEITGFMEILQYLYENWLIYPDRDFKITNDGELRLNFPKVYNAYAARYKHTKYESAPERSVIQIELAKICNKQWEEISKPIKFTTKNKAGEEVSMAEKNACYLDYQLLVEKFGIQLTGRRTNAELMQNEQKS